MHFNLFKFNFLTFISVSISAIIEAGGTLLLEALYHDFLRFIAFQLLFGCLVYYLFSIFRKRVKKKFWEYTSGFSILLSLLFFLFLSFFIITHFSRTEDGFSYLRGNNYTENAIKYKIITSDNDDLLVESVGNQLNLVWKDSENIKKYFLSVLTITSVILVISWCSYLQIRKFDRKKISKTLKTQRQE